MTQKDGYVLLKEPEVSTSISKMVAKPKVFLSKTVVLKKVKGDPAASKERDNQ